MTNLERRFRQVLADLDLAVPAAGQAPARPAPRLELKPGGQKKIPRRLPYRLSSALRWAWADFLFSIAGPEPT